MKTTKILVLVLVGIMCASVAHTAETLSTELFSLIKAAAERNQDIKAAKAKWASTVSLVKPTGALPDPNFGVSWENIPPGDRSLGAAGMEMLSISQRFPFMGKLSLMKDIAGKESAVYR